MARRSPGLSPVSMITSMPSACECGYRARRRRAQPRPRQRSGRSPGPVRRARRRSCPAPAALRVGSRRRSAACAQSDGVPSRNSALFTMARTPLPGCRVEIRRRQHGEAASRRVLANGERQRMRGSLLERRRELQYFRLRCSPPARSRRLRAGGPRSSVPVLSTTSTSSLPARSSAAAFLMRMPAPAPRPLPTMMAVGVARPSAHGQAITSTATALISAPRKVLLPNPPGGERNRADRPPRPARKCRISGPRAAGSALSNPVLLPPADDGG